MLSVLCAAGAHPHGTGWQLPSTETLVAVALVAVATVVGAWLARRGSGRSTLMLAAASGILLVIAVLDLLPGAWEGAHEAGVPPWAVPLTALASYGVMGAVMRIGCPCDRSRAGGIGAASALAVHRFLEGATLALTASLAVLTALLVHAAGEGLALAALLAVQPGRRVAPWIALACLSPVAGALLTGALPIPDTLMPLLLACVGGVLAQAAWVALRLAHQLQPAHRRVLAVPAATAMTLAAVLTSLVLLLEPVNR
ncbi:hypothetical protein [Streptomyces tropicalis]|uniref:Permease n=1 Tax=Streptomyces tropicalis TaxID=3034234 RepID=A0ABT6A694_9ACTN|nr:hypothetical protein [Streptomyces tropicalis]MDF3300162.1 hypothetical protein [Streptomyces tropicalis]